MSIIYINKTSKRKRENKSFNLFRFNEHRKFKRTIINLNLEKPPYAVYKAKKLIIFTGNTLTPFPFFHILRLFFFSSTKAQHHTKKGKI